MASDPNLVYWETSAALVISEAGSVPNGHLFTDKRLCWYVMSYRPWPIVIMFFTQESVGTLITNFEGQIDITEEISRICTERILENHPLGRQSLGCAWILAFTILRTIAEQLDFVFEIFDPIHSSAVSFAIISPMANNV